MLVIVRDFFTKSKGKKVEIFFVKREIESHEIELGVNVNAAFIFLSSSEESKGILFSF
jgi:hypothetical protein